MDDLSAAISQILGDPEKMKQLQAVASSLGLDSHMEADGRQPERPVDIPVPAVPPAPAPDLSGLAGMLGGLGGGQGGGTPDLSALAGMLGGLGGGQGGGTPDLSGLTGLLGGLSGSGKERQPQSGGGFDVGALAGLLRSGNPAGRQESGDPGGFNMGTLLKLQQAMANVQQNRSNIDLLLALKPRLSEARAKKVDDAIRVMQLIQFLPLLKETGLFGEMDSLLGGLGGGVGGGLSGLLGGGLGDGLGSLLGGLTGRGRR